MDLGTLMDMNMVEPMMIVTIGDLGEVSDVNGVATLLPMLEEGMQQSQSSCKEQKRTTWKKHHSIQKTLNNLIHHQWHTTRLSCSGENLDVSKQGE